MARWTGKADAAALAHRLRAALGSRPAIAEKPTFGGVCFLLRGNMLCGTGKQRFVFRVAPARHEEARGLPGAAPMVVRGRTMQGFFRVEPAACDAAAVKRRLALAESHVGRMPAKAGKRGK